jgi:competence protein ComEC
MFQSLVIWCLCFCLGIVVGSRGLIAVPVFFMAAAVFLIAAGRSLARRRMSSVFLFSLAFCCGALDLMNSMDSHAARGKVFVSGAIISDPQFSKRTAAFTLQHSCGKIRVTSYAPFDYRYGDVLEIEGSVSKRYGTAGKNVFGDDPVLIVKKSGWVKRVARGRGLLGKKLAFALKHKAQNLIIAYFKPPFSDILAAMMLGEGAKVPSGLRDVMVRAGTWHLMVVSGSHTAFLACWVMLILKIFRVKRRLKFILTIFFLGIYCLLTGATSPVVRATVMTTVFLLTYLAERNPHFLNALALAALSILIFDPGQLFDVGFQLSFLSVFFIFGLYPKMKKIIPEVFEKYRFTSWLTAGFCVSLSAWLGTAPLLAGVFKTFSLVSILANMAVAPLATLVMAGGCVFLGLGSAGPSWAAPLAASVEFFIFLFVRLNAVFSRPAWASWDVSFVPLSSVFLAYFFIVFYVLTPEKKP